MQTGFGFNKTITEHKFTICKLARINSNTFVSASWDNTLKIWTFDGECISTLKGHVGHVVSVVVLSNGIVVSGSEDQTIKFWKMDGSCIHTIHIGPIQHLMELREGRILIGLLHKARKAQIYSVDGKFLKIIQGDDPFWTAIIQLQNENLVTASFDGTIKIWNSETLECINTIHKHHNIVSSLCLLKNDKFASASWDDTITIWNQNGDLLEWFAGNAILTIIGLSNDYIALGSVDKTIQILDQNGKCVQVLEGHSSEVCCLLELRDGILVSASDDCSIIIWNRSILQFSRCKFVDVMILFNNPY
jgi:WD40 repeat protein